MKDERKSKNKKPNFNINPDEIWSDDRISKVREYIVAESQKQSPERRLRNELLAIKYRMEDYIENDTVKEEYSLLDFVKLYLDILSLSKKDLANAFEMRDTNLHKYLTGERKLNPDIVLKLSSFSHTKPEIWYYIEIKNQLKELKKEKDKLRKYKKYSFEKLIAQ